LPGPGFNTSGCMGQVYSWWWWCVLWSIIVI
jgi:hypothetical protein